MMLLVVVTSCGQQQKDRGIKEMIGTTAREETAFVGVNYSVANGIVTLGGFCATEEERVKVESKVKQTAGVKAVNNQIVIAPVVLDGGHLLKREVDSVLMKYPSVYASVQDSIIYLQGNVGPKQMQKIMTALESLGAKAITNQLLTSNTQ